MRSDRIDGPESRGGVLGCWRGAGGTYGRTGRQARGVDLAIREQHEVRSELQAFCRTPYTDHSDSQIPRTARCRTTARSSHLGNGYGISVPVRDGAIGIVYAGMRLPLRPSAAGATTVRTPAFARVPRDLAERTRGPLCMRRRRDAREPWGMARTHFTRER